MLRRILTTIALLAAAACANSNSARNDHRDLGQDAAAEAERVRDRTNTRAPASANDNSPVNQGVDEVRGRSNSNAQDPK